MRLLPLCLSSLLALCLWGCTERTPSDNVGGTGPAASGTVIPYPQPPASAGDAQPDQSPINTDSHATPELADEDGDYEPPGYRQPGVRPPVALAEPTLSAQEEALLQQLLSPQAIGMDLEIVNRQVGGTRRVQGDVHHYSFSGCSFAITAPREAATATRPTTRRNIAHVQVLIEPSCTADTSSLWGTDFPVPVQGLTFQKVSELYGDGHYLADCLLQCNNAKVYWASKGSATTNFLEMVLILPMSTEANSAAQQWRATMLEKEGREWVRQAQFNCAPERYDAVAARAFGPLQPQSLQFGTTSHHPSCQASSSLEAAAPARPAQVPVPQPQGECDITYDQRLSEQGLVPQRISVHGNQDQDFVAYGCPYRIEPPPGIEVPTGSTVTFRSAWEDE